MAFQIFTEVKGMNRKARRVGERGREAEKKEGEKK